MAENCILAIPTPDDPIVDEDDDPIVDEDDVPNGVQPWKVVCPKCEAELDSECTSLVSGCCFDGFHYERIEKAIKNPL